MSGVELSRPVVLRRSAICAQYTIDKPIGDIALAIRALIRGDGADVGRVTPRRRAPVVVRDPAGRALTAMSFGLVPAWSPTPSVKFATHNARLMSSEDKSGRTVPIYDKPTWREPFRRRHCLVPMTSFIEPIYEGELAGHMVAFRPEGRELFTAAGIWDEWIDKATGEVRPSFTVLTDDPAPDVARRGHDRTPVFLEEGDGDAWLLAEDRSPRDWVDFLRGHAAPWRWTAAVDRPLAPGWTRRPSA
jgi:putative SOS response-associated peptidase YedK